MTRRWVVRQRKDSPIRATSVSAASVEKWLYKLEARQASRQNEIVQLPQRLKNSFAVFLLAVKNAK